jgi:hypothetical protein
VRSTLALLFAGMSLALVAPGAEDRAVLLKRAAQFEQGLQARAADLLVSDETLKEANGRLKQRQQVLADALAAHPEMAALAPVRTTNAMAYRRQYVPLRARLLHDERQLRELYGDVVRSEQELARRLADDEVVKGLRERLAAAQAQLADAPLP